MGVAPAPPARRRTAPARPGSSRRRYGIPVDGCPGPCLPCAMAIPWNDALVDQLDWHWTTFVRPAPRRTRRRALPVGAGRRVLEHPPPGRRHRTDRRRSRRHGAGGLVAAAEAAPVTTIAWRMAHIAIGVFGQRAVNHFGADGLTTWPTAAVDWPITAGGRPGPARPLVRRVDRRRPRPRRRRPGPPVRSGRRAVRRRAAGDAGAAHQPRGAAPQRGDPPAARPVRAHRRSGARLTRRAGTCMPACGVPRRRSRLLTNVVVRSVLSVWSWLVLGVTSSSGCRWSPSSAWSRRSTSGRYAAGPAVPQAGRRPPDAQPAVALPHRAAWRSHDPRRPYVVVANHESFVDILLISHLPWEMKWLAKDDFFRYPRVGWLMRMAGDVPHRARRARPAPTPRSPSAVTGSTRRSA